MESVGYDLYCKMLNEAVANLKGIPTGDDFETVVDIDVDAYVPATYIKSESQKLDVYKRIAAITNEEELSDMVDELTDRFGDVPKSAHNLMKIAMIKSVAHNAYILEMKADKKSMVIKMLPTAKIDPSKIPDMVREKGSSLRFTNDKIPYFTYYFSKDDIKNSDCYIAATAKLAEEILGLKMKEEKNE